MKVAAKRIENCEIVIGITILPAPKANLRNVNLAARSLCFLNFFSYVNIVLFNILKRHEKLKKSKIQNQY